MYNTRLVEVFDGFCITFLIPLTVLTLLLNVLALSAVIRLRKDSHISVLGHLIFCDILLVVCQSYTLKALVTGRAVSMEVDIMCNVCGVIFNVGLSVTWWCLTLAHLIKMWQVSLSRVGYWVSVGTIWAVASFLAISPCFTERKYYLSWTHGMCVSDDRSLFNFAKLTTEYDLIFSILKSVQYAFPIIICMCSIAKDIYSPAKRIRAGWSCTVMIFLTYLIFFVLWWVDDISRHLTTTSYPIPTSTIVRRTITFMLLYVKPISSFLCLYHFMANFRSSFLRIIQLEQKLGGSTAALSEQDYERMYTEIETNGDLSVSVPRSTPPISNGIEN